MSIIPIDKQPNQKFTIRIENKNVKIELITRGLFMYSNISVEEEPLFNGVICLNKINLIQYKNTKLKGSLYFKDTQGDEAPVYTGLNDRWLLVYEE